MTHICISELNIIGSDNGLSPGRHQASIWTNAGILLIGYSGTNFSEILITIQTFSFKKMHLKLMSGKLLPFFLSLNELSVVASCEKVFMPWIHNVASVNISTSQHHSKHFADHFSNALLLKQNMCIFIKISFISVWLTRDCLYNGLELVK